MCSPKLRDHPPQNALEGICGHESTAFKLLLAWTEGTQEVGMPPTRSAGKGTSEPIF